MNRLKRTLLITGGFLCVLLAFLGILLPILPTTPFLLLAAYLFARSSDRFLDWLLHNRWFGEYIRNYREGRGMPAREKAIAIVSLWATILFTSFYFVPFWWVRVLLLAIAGGVTFHLLRIKTYRREVDDPHYRHAQSWKPD